MYTVLDLFSGIGGFSIGLERTGGFKTIAFCEYDKAAQKVLKLRWPGVPIYPDIRELTGDEITADVITGGYPCQPFSVAGKRGGATDYRHLWPEMYRIIKAVRPRWVIAENVAGHVSMGLDAVLSDMEAAHYTCWPFVIPACAVDARHRRDRVWVVANCDKDYNWNKRPGENVETFTAGARAYISGGGVAGQTNVANTASGRQSGSRQSIQWRCDTTGGKRQADYVEPVCESRFWPTEPAVGRVANGIPHRMDRLKQLGNSVVPAVVTIIGRAILKSEAMK